MRPAALRGFLLVLALTATLATAAQAATTRSLCARTAVLLDSPPPDGFVIGRLHRPQRLQVQRRSANRRWVLVVTRTGTAGWLRARSLCRA